MDSATWPGSNASAQHNVGPIPMGFEWSREQNLSPSDSSARSMGLQNTFHAQGANQNSANSNGNGNGGNTAGGPGNLVEESGLGHNGVPGGVGSASGHHNGDPLASTLAANTLPQSGDLQLRANPPSPPRDDSHHHPHSHHTQQPQLHVHHTHSPYHHSQISGHELSQHEQQQQQSFQSQHSAYASAHYYAEPDQHDPYEHGRMHSGGLVGHSYGHSHDSLAALTPPPPAPVPSHDLPPLRTRLTNTIWEDEHTFCYQVDVKGVCVARRADNHMVNGTKLLNVVGMSRGKRDGILKNEKGRVVVKVGAMHLKGVWIPLDRAMHHAKAHNIEESLYPLLVDDPTTFLYQHPHTAQVPSDMRWAPQSQQQHGSYHETDDSPRARHSDMHPNHQFNQGVHGDYYSHQHHTVIRGHGVNSPHGSPHGSNGSLSGDEDRNLVSPFDYRVQPSMSAGGLIGIPSGGQSSVSDMRAGGHHAAYYGHQASPNQYYRAHMQQGYQDSIVHPSQHQLQLGGPLANDSPPPLQTSSAHDGPQSRIHAGLLTGQKRGYGANVPEAAHNYYNNHQVHSQKQHNLPDVYPTDPGQFGLPSSGMSGGNFSPPMSMTPSEPHSPMSQQQQPHHSQDQHPDLQLQNQGLTRQGSGSTVQNQPMNPPSKRPRQVSRGVSIPTESSAPSSAQWYTRDEGFDRSNGGHALPSGDAPGAGSVGYSMPNDGSNGGIYYDNLTMAQQQQQSKSFNAAREGDAGQAGRPRFMPGAAQTPLQYAAAGPSSPQRSRSRLSSYQDGASAGGAMPQQSAMTPFGRAQNSMSPDDTKQAGYGRAQSGPEGESNVQLIKVEGVSAGFGHDPTNWS
ncbi:hypothetical protein BGZ67_005414 [Mortierella alpina]|nr:hypothetical protein BGZ67_005414 [Mortierella alpina]